MSEEDKEQTKRFPIWFGNKLCGQCEKPLPYKSYYEVGLKVNGPESGELFIRYACPHCDCNGIITFGDSGYTLEVMCELILDQSRFMRNTEKILSKRKLRGY